MQKQEFNSLKRKYETGPKKRIALMLHKTPYENFQNQQGLPQNLKSLVKPKQTSSQVHLTSFQNYVHQLVSECQIQDYKPQYTVQMDEEGKMDMSSLTREREAQTDRRRMPKVERGKELEFIE